MCRPFGHVRAVRLVELFENFVNLFTSSLTLPCKSPQFLPWHLHGNHICKVFPTDGVGQYSPGCKLQSVTVEKLGAVPDLEQFLRLHGSSYLLQGWRQGRHLGGCVNNSYSLLGLRKVL